MSSYSEVVPFQFESHEIRTVVRDGEPWFVARDVCDVLGLNNVGEALKGLDDDELTSELLMSGGQQREMKLVSESGLYNLIFKSRKPQAKTFRKWVTAEVLPSIRKTGSYSIADSGDRLNLDLLREVGYATKYADMCLRSVRKFPKTERDRLLNRMVLEATGYDLAERLGLPKGEGEQSLSDIKSFIDVCCSRTERHRERLGALYALYADWLDSSRKPLSKVLFRKKLELLGWDVIHRGGQVWVMDIMINDGMEG